MADLKEKIDLDRLGLQSGEARKIEADVAPAPIHLGGQDYEFAESPQTGILDVSRTTTGYALRLRFVAPLRGPCVRCLEAAALAIEVDAREVDQPRSSDEELQSPYVSDGELDLARWALDALILATPSQPLCRVDCAGLCAVCGASLNDADPAEHEHGGQRDPRWAALDQLKGE